MNEDNDDDDANEMALYDLGPHGAKVVRYAQTFLAKLLHAPFIRPAQVVSVAKLAHVLSRLPRPSAEMNVSVTLTGPRRQFAGQGEKHEIYHWWEVGIEGENITVCSGGHFYRPSSGGDSFTAMHWSAAPGCDAAFSDYLPNLSIVNDALPFDREIDQLNLSDAGYSLAVDDQDNSLLDEFDDDDVDEVDVAVDVGNEINESNSLTVAEQQLVPQIDMSRAKQRDDVCFSPPSHCDLCGVELAERALFIDGRLRGQIAWANMCAECLHQEGEGIGWGNGQVFMRQPDGRWLCVAGFPPED